MLRFRLCLAVCALLPAVTGAQERGPRSLDPRVKIELFAEQPQIVTPTGLDVDSQGRVWALESNTHFPPSDYAGHKSDRLLVMQGQGSDGRAAQIDPFADGFTHAMSVAVRRSAEAGQPDQVYVATRREIVILTDADGDLRADDRRRIVHLETAGNYPHNGLAGFAWDAQGWMYFGFGENLGADYKIIGSDGRTLSGGGEGGNLYRCRPDGTQLMQWATGFWNPHASCFDAGGSLFTVDNDPDSRPPCRLLHIIRDGDYGYRFRNGRKGLHPFTAWNGEVPGTLPMVAGTGEAPSGIVAYESDGLPAEYIGNLLVTSWGDHRIDRFRLKAKGASYESLAEPLIVGGENFRPVGLAIAPDGSLYCTDWVLKDYKLHGKGRVWRISGERATQRRRIEPVISSHDARCRELMAELRAEAGAGVRRTNRSRENRFRDSQEPVFQALETDDPFLFSAAVQYLSAARFDEANFRAMLAEQPPRATTRQRIDPATIARTHLAWLLAARLQQPKALNLAKVGLESVDVRVRRLAVQWVAEERLSTLRPQVEALLNEQPMTTDLFVAVLAALEMLDGRDPSNIDKTPAGKYVLPILLDESRPAAVRAQALRLVPPNDRALTAVLLRKLMATGDRALTLEAVRTLQASPLADAVELLRDTAVDESADVPLRAEAILGLAPALMKATPADPTHQTVLRMLESPEPDLVIQSLRALRGRELNDALKDRLLKLAKRLGPHVASLTHQQREMAEELARLLPQEDQPTSVRQARSLRPASVSQWMSHVNSVGDVEAGRRVFFHQQGAGCWKCHTVDGRGGAIGPDLSLIARTMNRQKLAQSILEPAREVAPQFTAWTFVMTSGQVHQGMILGDTRDGKQRIGLADGRELDLTVSEIEQREPSPLSIMPANLIEQLTLSELRHLLAFLESLK